jgi:hypothetical protein
VDADAKGDAQVTLMGEVVHPQLDLAGRNEGGIRVGNTTIASSPIVLTTRPRVRLTLL